MCSFGAIVRYQACEFVLASVYTIADGAGDIEYEFWGISAQRINILWLFVEKRGRLCCW